MNLLFPLINVSKSATFLYLNQFSGSRAFLPHRHLTYLLYHTLSDLSSIIFNFFKLFLGGVTKGEEKEVVCCSPLVHSYYNTDTGKSQ